ncbi:MAG: hypothetical protein ISP41_17955 [Alphaproteobacteria bacterium]|jgi:hypothetical protein|nr:hypothetical protein [Alphaproteobacteria bacterium]
MSRAPFLLVLGFLALLLAACEEEPPEIVNHREGKPPPGVGGSGDVCVLVRNRAPFTITGRVQLKSRERATFRLGRNKAQKLCMTGQLFGGDTVSFILTSFVTIPIFSCYTRHDQSIDVYAKRRGEGWLYSATCVR